MSVRIPSNVLMAWAHTDLIFFCVPVSITDECINTFNDLRMKKGDKLKFIIFKIADNKKEVVVDEASTDQDYDNFRKKLEDAKDSNGKPAPRYAVYDVEYELGGNEGKRYGVAEVVLS
ncbi:unnamed protein product [Aspergillus oryzae]|nr:unnamed protein product [Aspergillus oryzae]GMF96830.1 unnamed protein product [Aspergillus oryzae]